MGEVDDQLRGIFADLQRGREALVDQQHLRPGGGGGTSGGVTDDWKASVDEQLKRLHDDIKRLTGYIIAGAVAPFLVLVGAMFTLATTTNARIDRVAEANAMTSKEVATTSAKVDEVGRRLDRLEAKIDRLLAR